MEFGAQVTLYRNTWDSVRAVDFIIDRIGEIVEAGVDEIMIGGMVTDNPDDYVRFDEEVLSVFS